MECNDRIHKGLYDMGMVTCEICNEDTGLPVLCMRNADSSIGHGVPAQFSQPCMARSG